MEGAEIAGFGRLGAFVAAMFIVSLTSGNYAFSVFSGALKHTLNLSQTDLDTIAVYPYLAGLLTWTAGIVNASCRAAARRGSVRSLGT